ncbi:hypothetical protein [Rhodococcoides fascians]|uniref:hypothetical protein n=1 Tax=Rhodococcoides fascians TaxID=1828 RepID=UPI0018AF7AA1|nr:hypothetical protein [Rhodococcus fascians]
MTLVQPAKVWDRRNDGRVVEPHDVLADTEGAVVNLDLLGRELLTSTEQLDRDFHIDDIGV